MFVSNSEKFPEHLRELLVPGAVLTVSGQPLAHYSPNGKETFFNDCSYVFDAQFIVTLGFIKVIDACRNSHLNVKYLGEYPAIAGYDRKTDDEYVFGVREELGFSIQVLGK